MNDSFNWTDSYFYIVKGTLSRVHPWQKWTGAWQWIKQCLRTRRYRLFLRQLWGTNHRPVMAHAIHEVCNDNTLTHVGSSTLFLAIVTDDESTANICITSLLFNTLYTFFYLNIWNIVQMYRDNCSWYMRSWYQRTSRTEKRLSQGWLTP